MLIESLSPPDQEDVTQTVQIKCLELLKNILDAAVGCHCLELLKKIWMPLVIKKCEESVGSVVRIKLEFGDQLFSKLPLKCKPTICLERRKEFPCIIALWGKGGRFEWEGEHL